MRFYAESTLRWYYPMVIRGDIPATSAKKIEIRNEMRIMNHALKGMKGMDFSYLSSQIAVIFQSMTKMWHTIHSSRVYKTSLSIRLSHRSLSNSPFTADLYFRF